MTNNKRRKHNAGITRDGDLQVPASAIDWGHPVSGIVINRPKSINVPKDQFFHKVLNQKIEAIDRRAKYLIFRLQNSSCLLLHLMLWGSMFYGTKDQQPDRTVQVQLSFGD